MLVPLDFALSQSQMGFSFVTQPAAVYVVGGGMLLFPRPTIPRTTPAMRRQRVRLLGGTTDLFVCSCARVLRHVRQAAGGLSDCVSPSSRADSSYSRHLRAASSAKAAGMCPSDNRQQTTGLNWQFCLLCCAVLCCAVLCCAWPLQVRCSALRLGGNNVLDTQPTITTSDGSRGLIISALTDARGCAAFPDLDFSDGSDGVYLLKLETDRQSFPSTPFVLVNPTHASTWYHCYTAIVCCSIRSPGTVTGPCMSSVLVCTMCVAHGVTMRADFEAMEVLAGTGSFSFMLYVPLPTAMPGALISA
jgi:hypothetical protein